MNWDTFWEAVMPNNTSDTLSKAETLREGEGMPEGTIERRKRKRREKPCPIGRRRWKTGPDGSLSTLERRRQ